MQDELNELERRKHAIAGDLDRESGKIADAKAELQQVTGALQETRVALTGALTLKGRSAAQGLLSRWKEVEAINDALDTAKAEEEGLQNTRANRRAREKVGEIMGDEPAPSPTGDGEGLGGGDEDAEGEEYGEEDFDE